jgi:hypothetical protein
MNSVTFSFNKSLDSSDLFKIERIPKEPELPQCYKGKFYTYPILPAEKNDDFVCIANRNDFSIKWYKIGEPIENFADSLGKSTMESLSLRDVKVFQPEDHNLNFPDLSLYSDQKLKDKLKGLGLSQKGSREDLFKRLADYKESPPKINSKQTNQHKFFKVAIAALSILALIGTHKRFGTLNPMNIYKQVFPRNIPQSSI